MKKVKFLVLGLFCLLLLVGCGGSKSKKNIVTAAKFEEVVSKKEFIFLDNMGSYADVDYITEAKKAILNDIVIEMIVYKDVASAEKVQKEQIENFKTIKSTAATENKENGKNYYKFWMVSNGYYMVSSRLENTLVFCKTQLNNKETVEGILKTLKY